MVHLQRNEKGVIERAETLYLESIKDQLTEDQLGLFLSIDLDSGDYEIGESSIETCDALKKRRPDAYVFTMRHGSISAGSFSFAPKTIQS
ncbi:MAG: hypothetical protein F4X40_01675 [Chloroflexi bacterium]|nr:hypothetical protein [Chloroflexota bacterium]